MRSPPPWRSSSPRMQATSPARHFTSTAAAQSGRLQSDPGSGTSFSASCQRMGADCLCRISQRSASRSLRRISMPRQEHQVGRFPSVFEERLTRHAHLGARRETAANVEELARARYYREVSGYPTTPSTPLSSGTAIARSHSSMQLDRHDHVGVHPHPVRRQTKPTAPRTEVSPTLQALGVGTQRVDQGVG